LVIILEVTADFKKSTKGGGTRKGLITKTPAQKVNPRLENLKARATNFLGNRNINKKGEKRTGIRA